MWVSSRVQQAYSRWLRIQSDNAERPLLFLVLMAGKGNRLTWWRGCRLLWRTKRVRYSLRQLCLIRQFKVKIWLKPTMVKHYDHLSLQRWPWVEDQFRLQLCLNKLPWDVLSHQPWCIWHNNSKLHQDPNASPGWAVAPSTWIRVWLKQVSDTGVD